MKKNIRRSTYDPAKWGKQKPGSRSTDKKINSLVNDKINDSTDQEILPFWGEPLVFLSNVFLISLLSLFAIIDFNRFLNGQTESVGFGMFMSFMDGIFIFLSVQSLRGSKTALEINFVVVMGLFGIIFLYLVSGGGIPGSTS